MKFKWLDNLTKRATETAQTTVSKNVKDKAKVIIPIGVGIGIGIWGIASFFGGSTEHHSADGLLYSQTSSVTNNFYIYTNDAENLVRIIKEAKL